MSGWAYPHVRMAALCLSLGSDYCFSDTPGNQHVKRWKIQARNCDVGAAGTSDDPVRRAADLLRDPGDPAIEAQPVGIPTRNALE